MNPPDADVAEWMGEQNEFRRGAERRFENHTRRIDAIDTRQDSLDKELAAMKVKVAAAAAIGSVVGGAIVTAIIGIGTKAIGG